MSNQNYTNHEHEQTLSHEPQPEREQEQLQIRGQEQKQEQVREQEQLRVPEPAQVQEQSRGEDYGQAEQPEQNLHHPAANNGDTAAASSRQTYRLAGFWVRFTAYIIDLIAISSGTALIAIIWGGFWGLSAGVPVWLGASLVSSGLLGAVYFLYFTKRWQQTLGKMIMGIKVVRTDGQGLDWGTLFFREVIGRFISQAGGLHIGYAWVAVNRRHQGWHDYFSDTYVVYETDIARRQLVEI